MFPAWYIGRHPERSIIVATYNEHYSWDLGRRVRDIMATPEYEQVFPGVEIKVGANAVNRVQTTRDGVVFSVGRGSSITGRGGHCILLDDPIKDRTEADSVLVREKLWTWYNQVLRTRLMDSTGTIVIVQTRWTEDDLVGRLIDPMNPYYNVEEAKAWRKIDLPALAEDNDILGRAPGEPLWPERFTKQYLEEIRATDPRGFCGAVSRQARRRRRAPSSRPTTSSPTTRWTTCRPGIRCGSTARRTTRYRPTGSPTRPA